MSSDEEYRAVPTQESLVTIPRPSPQKIGPRLKGMPARVKEHCGCERPPFGAAPPVELGAASRKKHPPIGQRGGRMKCARPARHELGRTVAYTVRTVVRHALGGNPAHLSVFHRCAAKHIEIA